VRAQIVSRAERYPWSSALAHYGLRSDPLLFALRLPRPVVTADWSAWLAEEDDEKMLATMRRNTRTGRPAGGEKFVADLESRLGRSLRARPIGQPRKDGFQMV
jgi:putative transposase